MPFDISRINKKTYLFYTVKRTHMTWSQVPLLSKTANTATVLPNALSDSIATSVKSILITDKIVFKIQNDFINEMYKFWKIYLCKRWLMIDWCLTPHLAVFQLYRGVLCNRKTWCILTKILNRKKRLCTLCEMVDW
jgi:hypothetical protein